MTERKLDRRAFTRKLAVGGGVAWMGPTIKSLFTPAAAASADGPPVDPPAPSGCCDQTPVLAPQVQQAPPPGQPEGFTYVLWYSYLLGLIGCTFPDDCHIEFGSIAVVNGPGVFVEAIFGPGPRQMRNGYFVQIPNDAPCETHTVQVTWEVSSTLDCQTFTPLGNCVASYTYTDPNCTAP